LTEALNAARNARTSALSAGVLEVHTSSKLLWRAEEMLKQVKAAEEDTQRQQEELLEATRSLQSAIERAQSQARPTEAHIESFKRTITASRTAGVAQALLRSADTTLKELQDRARA